MSELVSVVIITRNRSDELPASVESALAQDYRPLEVIVLENGSTPEVQASNEEVLAGKKDVLYLKNSENLGVSGGRSLALSKASGKVVVELDDDAIFEDEHALSRAVSFFKLHPKAGILAFRITNYHTRTITPQEYPFRDKDRDPFETGPCAWFIGAGHAFTRELLDTVGSYREFFPWGSEEQDLSLRALDAGFQIYYVGSIGVFHKKSPHGRIDNAAEFASIALKNRVKFAALNLPWPSVVSHFCVRGMQSALKTGPGVPLRALKLLADEWGYVRDNRRPIGPGTLRLLSRLRGQRYF